MNVVTLPGMGFDCNIYVVEAERPVLIDTGTGYYNDMVLEKLRRLDIVGLDRIFLTHRHCDHAGGAAFLAKELGAKVHAPPLEAEAVRKVDSSTGSRDFGIPMEPVPVEALEGELDLGDCAFKILATPGHTEGSVSLLHEETMTLISGDTVFADGGVGRWDLETGDYEALLASVEMLAKLGASSLYPGHGPVVKEGAGEHVRASLAYLKRAGSWGL